MMMRKTSLILLGAAAGVAVTLIATPPRIVLDGARAQTAAAADTYRQLSLFGDVFERVRGPENSKIKLKIMRKGQDKPVEVTITRARIQVRSVRSRMEGDDVGFIRVTQFNEQATGDLKKAITDLSTQAGDKLKAFVIDLRNNPGGLLDQAISVSDAFLERGEIVSIRGRTAEETQRFNARAGDLTKSKPVIVLINGGSASASEIDQHDDRLALGEV